MSFIFTRVLKNRNSVCIYGSTTFRAPGGRNTSRQAYLGKIAIPSGKVHLNARHGAWLSGHGLGFRELEAALLKGAARYGLTLPPAEEWCAGGTPLAPARAPARALTAAPAHSPPRDQAPAPESAPGLNRGQPPSEDRDRNRGPSREGALAGEPPGPRDPEAAPGPDPPDTPDPELRAFPAAEQVAPLAPGETQPPRPLPEPPPAGPPLPRGALERGHIRLLRRLSAGLGLGDVLARRFPGSGEEILQLAFHAACGREGPRGFGTFARRSLLPASERLATPEGIAEVLAGVSQEAVSGFLAEWRESLGEDGFDAFDASARASRTEPEPPAPSHGDGRLLREIRLCAAFGKRTRLPAGISLLHGPPGEVAPLAEACRRAAGGGAAPTVHAGPGLWSPASLAWLARELPGPGFSLTLPETDPAFPETVMEILMSSAEDQSILPFRGGSLIGFAKRVEVGGSALFACVFLDSSAKFRAEDAVLLNSLDMLELAAGGRDGPADGSRFAEALDLTPGGNGREVAEIRPGLIQELTFGSGWSVVLHDRETGLAEALHRRGKAGLARRAFSWIGTGMRDGGDGCLWGEILVAFTALALLSSLYNAMEETGLFETRDEEGLLEELGLAQAAGREGGAPAGPSAPGILALFAALDGPAAEREGPPGHGAGDLSGSTDPAAGRPAPR
ncbi:MAG: hypothetical protein LBG06_08430 [Deltaproteobacteria bacterium]|jgi:hypothetical protein|nr:hypothetical protein [Deltaproteobacteria bacterium]